MPRHPCAESWVMVAGARLLRGLGKELSQLRLLYNTEWNIIKINFNAFQIYATFHVKNAGNLSQVFSVTLLHDPFNRRCLSKLIRAGPGPQRRITMSDMMVRRAPLSHFQCLSLCVLVTVNLKHRDHWEIKLHGITWISFNRNHHCPFNTNMSRLCRPRPGPGGPTLLACRRIDSMIEVRESVTTWTTPVVCLWVPYF